RTDSVIPQPEDLERNIVGEGAVPLALLVRFAKTEARSFPSGKLVNRTDEPLEVRFLFPRAVLDRYPDRANEHVPDRPRTPTLPTRSDDETLGDEPPAGYLPGVEPHELVAHLIARDPALWTVEAFTRFCEQRERALAEMIRELLSELGLG